MRNKSRTLMILFFLLCGSELLYADFMVHLKDGTSRQVTKIVLRGEKADLVLPNHVTITVLRVGIDYRFSAIQEPDFPNGICINGKTFEPVEAKKNTRISQEQLKELWDQPGRIAIATKDGGSIHKGQQVRVVSESNGSYSVVLQDSETEEFRRIVLAEESFDDMFGTTSTAPSKPPTPNKMAPAAPENTSSPEWIPLKQAAAEASAPIATLNRPSLLIPAAMSLAILIIGLAWTFALSAISRDKKSTSRKSS